MKKWPRHVAPPEGWVLDEEASRLYGQGMITRVGEHPAHVRAKRGWKFEAKEQREGMNPVVKGAAIVGGSAATLGVGYKVASDRVREGRFDAAVKKHEKNVTQRENRFLRELNLPENRQGRALAIEKFKKEGRTKELPMTMRPGSISKRKERFEQLLGKKHGVGYVTRGRRRIATVGKYNKNGKFVPGFKLLDYFAGVKNTIPKSIMKRR